MSDRVTLVQNVDSKLTSPYHIRIRVDNQPHLIVDGVVNEQGYLWDAVVRHDRVSLYRLLDGSHLINACKGAHLYQPARSSGTTGDSH